MSVGVLIIAHNDIGLSLVNTASQMIKENPLKIKVLAVDLESTTDELHKNALSLIESIDNGLYCKSMGGGSVGATGQFNFWVEEGYFIKNG